MAQDSKLLELKGNITPQRKLWSKYTIDRNLQLSTRGLSDGRITAMNMLLQIPSLVPQSLLQFPT